MHNVRLHPALFRSCCVAIPLAAGACGSDTTGSIQTNFSGIYSITQVMQAQTCAPQALPAQLLGSSGSYISIPPAGTTTVQNTIAQSGATFSVIPMPNGVPEPAITLTGTIDASGNTNVTRPGTFGLEGARSGGHTFYVTILTTGAGHFQTVGTAMQFAATYNTVSTFREGSATGAVFTTCTSTYSHAGTRTS